MKISECLIPDPRTDPLGLDLEKMFRMKRGPSRTALKRQIVDGLRAAGYEFLDFRHENYGVSRVGQSVFLAVPETNCALGKYRGLTVRLIVIGRARRNNKRTFAVRPV